MDIKSILRYMCVNVLLYTCYKRLTIVDLKKERKMNVSALFSVSDQMIDTSAITKKCFDLSLLPLAHKFEVF